jgi:hypothetical protein
MEYHMKTRTKNLPPALKHGVYSAMAVLPGEDPAKFAELYQSVIAELIPNGAIEHDIVENIARLIWRMRNLVTLRMRKHGEQQSLETEKKAPLTEADYLQFTAEQLTDMYFKEIGSHVVFASNGEAAPYESLNKDLEIEERIGTMIDRNLKRLLFLRGLKSMPTSAVASAPQKSLPGRSPRAA